MVYTFDKIICKLKKRKKNCEEYKYLIKKKWEKFNENETLFFIRCYLFVFFLCINVKIVGSLRIHGTTIKVTKSNIN